MLSENAIPFDPQSDLNSNYRAGQKEQDFDELYRRYRARAYFVAHRSLRHTQEAEDVTQEAFARIWANFASFDPNRPFEAWLFRIVTNICIDRSRRKKRWSSYSLDSPSIEHNESLQNALLLPDTTYDPARCLLAGEIDERLEQGLAALPDNYRTVVLLAQCDHTYAEIGRILNCPVGTIRSRIHRARLLLRHHLEA